MLDILFEIIGLSKEFVFHVPGDTVAIGSVDTPVVGVAISPDIACVTTGSNINGADKMIPDVPQMTQIRKIQRNIRSITIATYFQSSVICNYIEKIIQN